MSDLKSGTWRRIFWRDHRTGDAATLGFVIYSKTGAFAWGQTPYMRRASDFAGMTIGDLAGNFHAIARRVHDADPDERDAIRVNPMSCFQIGGPLFSTVGEDGSVEFARDRLMDIFARSAAERGVTTV